MSNRKIINAAATGGIGYYPVGNPTDTYYDNVSLLLNGDVEVDSNFANVSLLLDGNTLTDKSNNKAAVTAYGNAAVSATKKKFGTGSYYFDGNGDYLSIPASTNFSFGTGDVTIEAWIWWESATYIATGRLICGNNGAGSTDQFGIFEGVGMSCFGISNNVAANYPPVQQWVHVACSKQGSTVRLFINGVMTASGTQTAAVGNSTYPMLIGTRANDTQWYHWWNGYIDDLRITKGVARYTSSFTPPVKALPTHAILDSSVYRLPVTAYGNVRIDTATKKFGTGAMYFDGSGDYINIATTSALTIGTGDFTYEAWIHPLNLQASKAGEKCIYYTGQSGILISLWNNNVHLASDYVADLADFSSTSVVNGSWFHLAITRSGTTVSCFINGQQAGSNVTLSTNFGTNGLNIGRYSNASMEFQGYMDDLRITKGIARYTANFTPPSASLPTIPPTIPADPWWGNVSLLLDGNTTDAYDPYWQNVSLMLTGDDFIDWSNQHNAVTNNGTVTLDTTNKKFNASSLAFSGSNYLTIPTSSNFSFGTGNFSIEFWVRFTTVGADQQVLSLYSNSSTARTIALYTAANGTLNYYLSNNGSSWDIASGVLIGNISTSTWYYVALVRNGNTFTPYLNAISGTPTTSALSINGTTSPVYIGSSFIPSSYFSGQIADLRITKGIARTIAVPTAALPSYKIQDRTQNNLTLTPYGNVQLSTDVMKNGTGSMFFDGTGDYLKTSASSNLCFGTGDFTIELWYYPLAKISGYPQILNNSTGWGANAVGFSDRHGNYPTKFGFDVYNMSSSLISNAVVVQDKWQHLAVVRSGTNIALYINGVLDNSITTSVNVDGGGSTFWCAGAENGNSNTFLNGYIDDLRITKGYARYTQNFTPPSQSFATQYISTGYDANYADVSLLLNGNGTNGSTTFTDLSSSPKTVTAYGNAQISTTQKKYGTGAIAFDGTGDYLTVPAAAGGFSGDFTIEGWFYYNSLSSGYCPIFDARNSSSYAGILLYLFSTGIYLYRANSGLVTTTLPPTNAWFHFAVTRKNATIYLFINGIQAGTATDSGDFPATTIYLGAFCDLYQYSNAYLDDFRITKGVARYTTNFTPPTYQLPTDTTGTVIDPLRSSTSLLLRGNGTNGSTSFTDESPNGLTVTNNGSVTVNTTTKKYGTGSMAFSGSNYLELSSNVLFNFGTIDFTMEGWFYKTVNGNVPGIVGNNKAWVANAWGVCASHPTYPNRIGLYVYNMNNTAPIVVSTSTLSLNTWYHFAVTRIGSTIRLFLNGALEATGTSSASLNVADDIIAIGNNYGDYLNGYIDDLRITKGYARYTANFTPPTYEDPIVTGTVYDYNYPQVSLLLNGDGTNGSTVFKDLSSSPKTITAYGNAQISTAQKKFGTGAMAFDGTGDYLSIPNNVGFRLLGDSFTVEFWVYFNVGWTNRGLVGIHDNSSDGWFLRTTGTALRVYNNGGGANDITTSFNTGQWYHIAWSSTGTSSQLFINGVSIATIPTSGVNNTANNLQIGQTTTVGDYLNGYIDDLRITKGLARYTQNFTPPTAPLPTSYS